MTGTNLAGYVQLLMAGVAAFAQIYAVLHGASLDVAHSGVTVGLAASGVAHAAHSSH